jgi:hypothetical protein
MAGEDGFRRAGRSRAIWALPPPDTWEPLMWEFLLPGSEARTFQYDFTVPSVAGSYVLVSELRAWASGAWTPVATTSLSLDVPRGADEIAADVVAALEALVLSGTEDAARWSAVTRVEGLAGYGPGEADLAIEEVLAAIGEVKQIESVDVTAIRIELARLLRAWQLESGE